MTVTKSNESSQGTSGPRLSMEQLNAIDILVQGRTDQETAETVGVARETVTRWRNDNPHFTAELNRQRRLIWGDSHDRLRALASKAVDTLETSLDEGDSRVALEVIQGDRTIRTGAAANRAGGRRPGAIGRGEGVG